MRNHKFYIGKNYKHEHLIIPLSQKVVSSLRIDLDEISRKPYPVGSLCLILSIKRESENFVNVNVVRICLKS